MRCRRRQSMHATRSLAVFKDYPQFIASTIVSAATTSVDGIHIAARISIASDDAHWLGSLHRAALFRIARCCAESLAQSYHQQPSSRHHR